MGHEPQKTSANMSTRRRCENDSVVEICVFELSCAAAPLRCYATGPCYGCVLVCGAPLYTPLLCHAVTPLRRVAHCLRGGTCALLLGLAVVVDFLVVLLVVDLLVALSFFLFLFLLLILCLLLFLLLFLFLILCLLLL